ncbi:adenylate/guanylate cyclase domain-containing protein [Schumannella sp. 10F1B-5-1]|uniref:adenylate/guanylate cyclase domain-containing protein n=1 Tax=Schumannella sp. 10F1B-5-1 TaxID=2590780 RepID=UPI00113163A0|nr:adenylate/guanylate cyclase domain-containing protein [Schumannella sp. 10F1B-5-1]TPW70218.1 HAMP domain-containing protein [Schumannella sp. 10F1B-5-1]
MSDTTNRSTDGDGDGNAAAPASPALGATGSPPTGLPIGTRRGRARRGISIQSKLLIMLLATSLVSTAVVGAIGYISATGALKEAALDQLVGIRGARAAEITRTMENIRTTAILASGNESAVAASEAFNAGFAELQQQTPSAADESAVGDFYSDTFVPALEKSSGEQFSDTAFAPTDPAGVYLQAKYTAPLALDYDRALAFADAGDGSAWSAANAEYNGFFSSLVERIGFEDALLLDTDGDVVYSAYLGADLGTNLRTGPYRDSDLAKAYDEVLATNSVDATRFTDFQRYVPSLNSPTAWALSPIGDADGRVTGVLALQIPADTINDVMTGDQGWSKQGLGGTGEVYLAGDDRTMRSISRELVQHPKQYERDAIAAGTPSSTAKEVVAEKTTILLQPLRNDSVTQALRGRTGTNEAPSYVGGQSLAAYAPLQIEGLNWVIVARITTAEAYAPAAEFTRNLVLSTAAIALLVSLLSLLLAQIFLRPLRRLQTAVQRVSAGELGVQVDTGSRDEVADLGVAFNDMSRSLEIKAELLDAERAEYDRLLHTVMPETVAKRYRQGDETIAEDHQDVTVIFGDIVGFDDFSRGMDSAQSLALLNDIVRGFDDAATRLGVERVRTTRLEGYLASCGLIVPRVDNARRVVEFAIEMQGVLDRLGAQHGAHLTLRAGVDSGTVTSGLIGRSSVVYDMWGDAVNLAHRVQDAAQGSGIYVTQGVADQLPDTIPLVEAEQLGDERVWKVDLEARRG